MEPATWRIIRTPPKPGAWNMAVDEAILEAVISGHSLPTLRLYAWEPACLSLGLAQPFKDVDIPALTDRGWHLVRRPTGGRAILHVDELTYSVSAPLDEPRLAGGVMESYRHLSQALVAALEKIGLAARADKEYQLSSNTTPGGAVCFETPSNYEITVQGRKLIGSAQARRKGGVLQHGSLPLSGDLTRIVKVLAYPDQITREEAAVSLLTHAVNAEMLGFNVSWETAAASFCAAFEEVLNLKLIEGNLTAEELGRAEQLEVLKYGSPAWTKRF
ncbi:MAG: lipoate--protein ligase family protein [Anaerolineaceae bacterium]|nr:lipoate--protein ligase family protein [Anaerolineaceae bacterium]